MSSEWDLVDADDMTGGGAYLEEPGTFHLLINEVHDGCGPNGNPIDGFSIECEVLAGTVENCSGKKVGLTIWKPNLTKGEKSIAMARRIASAFFIATDLTNPNALGKSATIDVNNARSKQIVARLAIQKDRDGNPTKFLQINYSDVFHVDDPEVATIPKDLDALQIVAAKLRHEADYFAFKAKKGAKPKQTPPPSADEFSDL
jgi:hypothetical protein